MLSCDVLFFRYAIPQDLHAGSEEDLISFVPCLRPCVHPPLRPREPHGSRSPREHLLQTFLLLCYWIQPHRPERTGASERDDITDVPLKWRAAVPLHSTQIRRTTQINNLKADYKENKRLKTIFLYTLKYCNILFSERRLHLCILMCILA